MIVCVGEKRVRAWVVRCTDWDKDVVCYDAVGVDRARHGWVAFHGGGVVQGAARPMDGVILLGSPVGRLITERVIGPGWETASCQLDMKGLATDLSCAALRWRQRYDMLYEMARTYIGVGSCA